MISDICKLRLDFETFTIAGTTSTTEGPVTNTDLSAGCNTCTDSFTVTVREKSNEEKLYYLELFARNNDTFIVQSIIGDNRTVYSSFVWSKYRTA